jgi:propionyl-CoA carboxylase alpha chain
LAVVEAMKMENSLRATQDAVVAKCLATVGENLVAEQSILEFE